jgi:hypothetical protein
LSSGEVVCVESICPCILDENQAKERLAAPNAKGSMVPCGISAGGFFKNYLFSNLREINSNGMPGTVIPLSENGRRVQC